MKRHHKDCCLGIDVRVLVSIISCVVFCFVMCMPGGQARAKSQSGVKFSHTSHGPQIEFVEGEYILVDGLDVPDSGGWERKPNPHIYRLYDSGWQAGDYHTLVGRFRFERSWLEADSLALYTISTRNNFSVSLNGTKIFQNYASVSDANNTWYRPYLVPLPDSLLSQKSNEIVIHVISQESVGIGRVLVGSHVNLQKHYRSKFFWQITAPMAVNFAMLLLGLFVFLFWLGRKQEIELLWLSVAALLWFVRNHLYFAETIPIHLETYILVTVYVTYFGAAASAAFYLCFIKQKHRNTIISVMFAIGVLLIFVNLFITKSDLVFYLPTIFIVMVMATLGFLDLKHHRNIERGVLGFAMMVTPLSSIYDLWMAVAHEGDGSSSYVAIFGGLFYTSAFIISFGKRTLNAFSGLEKANVTLENRIRETRAELAASEAMRQKLVVSQAISEERGRLMQEMHDGIGSNLVTALAIARQQKQPKTTLVTLERALNDLKITVDSLEPVEGDLVTLIGNLRHRMARDLSDAGIVSKWEVEDCDPLPWLDATNALHVLRIFSEAIGNVLAHSGATEIRIGCAEGEHEGVAGIVTYVADNGKGFDPGVETPGKGLSNIRARVRSLHGHLSCVSSPQNGTRITLWLPYVRKMF